MVLMAVDPYTRSLYHHGIQGQKWGVRRYQNPDGSLTAEGKQRYKAYAKDETVRARYDKNVHDSKTARFVGDFSGGTMISWAGFIAAASVATGQLPLLALTVLPAAIGGASIYEAEKTAKHNNEALEILAKYGHEAYDKAIGKSRKVY